MVVVLVMVVVLDVRGGLVVVEVVSNRVGAEVWGESWVMGGCILRFPRGIFGRLGGIWSCFPLYKWRLLVPPPHRIVVDTNLHP